MSEKNTLYIKYTFHTINNLPDLFQTYQQFVAYPIPANYHSVSHLITTLLSQESTTYQSHPKHGIRYG